MKVWVQIIGVVDERAAIHMITFPHFIKTFAMFIHSLDVVIYEVMYQHIVQCWVCSHCMTIRVSDCLVLVSFACCQKQLKTEKFENPSIERLTLPTVVNV